MNNFRSYTDMKNGDVSLLDMPLYNDLLDAPKLDDNDWSLDDLYEWTTSKFQVNHGPRRAGKTLKMTNSLAYYLVVCEWINRVFAHLIGTSKFMKPLQVWSSYPIEFMYRAADDGAKWKGANEPVLLKTLPLDFGKFIQYDPEISWGFLGIDELNKRADRQQWMTGGQPLLMERLVEVGKSHLSCIATVQSLNWINPRFMFQVDVTTLCRDASKTAWGKENNVKAGDLTFLYSKDLSGGETGYSYEESGIIYESHLYGKPTQQLYDTDKIDDPFAHYETYKIIRKRHEIDPNAKETLDDYPYNTETISTVLENFIKNDELKPSWSEFKKECEKSSQATFNKPFTMERQEAISYLEDVFEAKSYYKSGYLFLNLTNVTGLQVSPKKSSRKKVKK
jgi:hypothetical protein